MACRTRITSLLRTGPGLRPAMSTARTVGRFSNASTGVNTRARASARARAPMIQRLQVPGYKRTLASGSTIGKPQGDLLVDELQEL